MITETTIFRTVDRLSVKTYLARPDGAGPFLALILCYEFWGMLEVPGGGPHMRDVAGRVVPEGYVVAVPDYYATIKGSPPDEEVTRDLTDGVHWLQQLPNVDGGLVGVVGWCGGGRQSLLLAAHCPDIRAAAGFCRVRSVRRKDQSIPLETAREFEAALKRNGVPHEIHVYPEAGHAFMNDQRDTYVAIAAERPGRS